MLNPDPKGRYANAAEMMAAIHPHVPPGTVQKLRDLMSQAFAGEVQQEESRYMSQTGQTPPKGKQAGA
jgi:hypothetical protein